MKIELYEKNYVVKDGEVTLGWVHVRPDERELRVIPEFGKVLSPLQVEMLAIACHKITSKESWK